MCEVDVRVQQSVSRVDSWVDIPGYAGERRADMPNPDRSMVVVYFDLVQNRVPSRYDAYLAIPSADAIARLERGEAFVAYRERADKKPLLMLAAPRAGQLDAVEAAFAEMTELPKEPHVVDVPKGRLPAEIQGVVRSGFRTFRNCYEALLAVDPKAAGKVTLKFTIDAAGAPQSITTESSFADAGIGKCIADHLVPLRFPASGGPTTVSYPIVFSP